MVGARDAAFMARALFLAERGAGRTSPNPIVGAVVVTPDGIVVGHGAHLQAGGPHAEVVALDEAGALARGATLYCTLEPCCHTGRTGPCVERIAAAGVGRVVAAMTDPNPTVRGRGFAFLRDRGIAVIEGVGAEEAARQNTAFACWVTRGRPHVTLKVAVSRDGFVGRAGERVRLTGPIADRFLHRQRAAMDAIAVGAGTVLTDDPALTVRLAYRARPFTRVIFDWSLRVPAAARVFSTLAAGPVIMVVSRGAARAQPDTVARFEDAGVVVLRADGRELAPVLRRLGARDLLSLLVEGGPRLHAAFLAESQVDRVQVVATPRVLGQGLAAAAGMDLGPGSALTRRVVLGDDELWETDVHRAD